MGRPTKIANMTIEEINKELSFDQKEFLYLVKTGRTDPVFFAEKLLGVPLHDKQKIWLWMTTKTQRPLARPLGIKLGLWTGAEFEELVTKNEDFTKNILVPSNRWGKTLVTAVKHIWYCYYKVGVRGDPENVAAQRCQTLNLSPHSNQCQAGYEYILDILLGNFVWTDTEYDEAGKKTKETSHKNDCKIPDFYVSDNSQKRLITFSNGTFYKAIPTGEDQASSLAGTPYLYISYDECAQSLHLKEELPAKIMSRLIDYGGPLDLVSTPEVDKPSHQYFFHIAKLGKKGEDGWWTLVGALTDNVFLGRKEIEKTTQVIKTTDPIKYRQVMYGEFVTTGKKMFDGLLVERLWDSQFPSTPLHDHKYLEVADWGFSDTGDPTVFYVLDYTNYPYIRVAFRESIRGGSPFMVLSRAKILQREWNGAKFIHDTSSMGGVMIKKMLAELEMRDVIDFSSCGGEKSDMLFLMNVVMSANRKVEYGPEGEVIDKNPEFGRLRSYYIAELEEQLGNYQYNPDKGVTDKKIEQDDVMALGMGIWWLEKKLAKVGTPVVNFHPFADTADKVFPVKEAAKLKMHNFTIPQKRIM